MVPVCSRHVSAVLYASVRYQAFENSMSADMLAGLGRSTRVDVASQPRSFGMMIIVAIDIMSM
jgi:hypothetical protein